MTRVEWNDRAVHAIGDPNANAALARELYLLAARIHLNMKRLCPVSPVVPVYARGGRPVPGGRRYAGDFPLRPSGHLRQSIKRYRLGDGSWIIGPTADYAEYVNSGTVPHEIRSHGPWPLRNRATGQVFGRIVHHPGTRGVHFVERAVETLPHESIRI